MVINAQRRGSRQGKSVRSAIGHSGRVHHRVGHFSGVLLLLAWMLCQPASAPASEENLQTSVLNYIHASWDSLTRGTGQCSSIKDPKLTSAPVVYTPYGLPVTRDLQRIETECHAQVRPLPRVIHAIGDVQPAELPAEGLLYLPHPYVVPGGRFNEMYGWDSYFIILGLLEDNRDDLARGMVDNFFFEIENYGALLNANRTYYLTRSQPPLLSSMIREVYEHHGAAPALDKAWLAHSYEIAVRDHALWTSEQHRAGDTGLARYHDLGSGPVPEMADDSTYYRDVIAWLLAHPKSDAGYLLTAPGTPTSSQVAALAKSSCDMRVSKVCAQAVVDGHRLTAAFYQGDRAMRESGFDTSFRFGAFSGSTENFAPICLNSLLYKYETDLAYFAEQLNRPQEEAHWKAIAEARRTRINQYLWDPQAGFFFDWNYAQHARSHYYDIVGFYPLWAGLASKAQAAAVVSHLQHFEHPGGLAMSDTDSGTQWDLPYGWAPTTWFAIVGLSRYGSTAQAQRAGAEFSRSVESGFEKDGVIYEKYNVVSVPENVNVHIGYKSNVVGFGWTNGVYLKLHSHR